MSNKEKVILDNYNAKRSSRRLKDILKIIPDLAIDDISTLVMYCEQELEDRGLFDDDSL